MSYEEAVALFLACWITGYALGFKLRQITDALNAS